MRDEDAPNCDEGSPMPGLVCVSCTECQRAQPADAGAGVCRLRRVSESTVSTLRAVYGSRLYRALLPLVQPYAEPAVNRIMASTTFQVRPSPHPKPGS